MRKVHLKKDINKKRINNSILLLGHIDQWFELRGKLGLTSHGQIHLILDFERLKV